LSPCLFREYLILRGCEPSSACSDSLYEDLVRIRHSGHEFEKELRRFLLIGGFPELFVGIADTDETSEILRSQRVLRDDAVRKSIYQDIPQSFGVDEPQKLERLVYILAGQMCGLLSPQSIASDIEMSQPTIDKYLRYLEESYLVFTLANYSSQEETIQRRGRKLYFFDGAIRNAALQRGLRPQSDTAEMGLLYENACAAHLRSYAHHAGLRLYHWRHRKNEVDFVLDDPERPMAFEIGSSPRHGVSGLMALCDRYERFRGSCFLVTPGIEAVPPAESSDGVGRVPLASFLWAIGNSAHSRFLSPPLA